VDSVFFGCPRFFGATANSTSGVLSYAKGSSSSDDDGGKSTPKAPCSSFGCLARQPSIRKF